jgi:5-methylthioribose kinase
VLIFPAVQDFEVAAMRFARATSSSNSLVTIPAIHHFDDIAHVVIMDDCGTGSLTLKQLMLTNPLSLSMANAVGKGLGEFLGRLHTRGLDTQASNHEFFDKNQQSKMMSGFVTYGQLMPTLTG